MNESRQLFKSDTVLKFTPAAKEWTLDDDDFYDEEDGSAD